MNKTTDRLITYALTPLSWLYGAGVYVRNKLFDFNLLKQEEFDIPVVSVGNISVGGTGKTPHVEYLVAHLADTYNIAVLSRGYKRKTKGFVLANAKSTPESIGDEPYQIWHKFRNRIKVAVCEKRAVGIQTIQELHPEVNLIILDDAFQHRYVKPLISVLLIDYNRSVLKDKLLPLGRLRESSHAIGRADAVVVTKCPDPMPPINYRITSNDLQLMAYQKLFFSHFRYEGLEPVFPDDTPYFADLNDFTGKDSVLLLTGIAQPRQFIRHFSSYPFRVKISHYPDHHDFTRKDIMELEEKFNRMKGVRKIILTTEKDAVRLAFNPYFPASLKPYVFYQPISVRMDTGLHAMDLVEYIRKEVEKRRKELSLSDEREEESAQSS